MFKDQRNIDSLINILKENSTQEFHPKGEILLKAGVIFKKLYFIKKGAIRFYYINDNGDDITHWFIFDNDFVTELDSFYRGSPSQYYMETLEDTELLVLTQEQNQSLFVKHPNLLVLWNEIMADYLVQFGEKVKDLQFRDAKTRYDNLILKYPDILQRVALGHIASYLGMTQQSLSRIRRLR